MSDKKVFIKHLAEYLAGTNQVEMSIKLGMGDRQAKMWAAMRETSPLHGYPTVEEAESTLTSFLIEEKKK